MSRAITLSFDTGAPWDENPYGDAAAPVDETGDFAQVLGSFLGGGGSGGGGGIGGSLGTLAGTGLGSLFGPAGAKIGAGIGQIGGSLIESAVRGATARKPAARPPKQKRLTKHEQRILAEGEAQTRKTGNPVFVEEAKLRVYRPAEYKRRRDAGTLASQRAQSAPPPPPLPSSSPRVKFPAPKPPGSSSSAITTTRALPATATRASAPSPSRSPSEPPIDVAPPDEPDLPSEEPVDEYDDTGAPVAERPAPAAHLSVLPLKDDYVASVLRDMPGMKDLDPRVLRLVTGGVSTARDVSGVDAATGTYHASPNETAYGITKKLTGQVERVQELLAANPQKPAEGSPIWNIPPGWLQYARGETGAPLTTSRKYVVQSGDFPRAIAEKLGATDRNWWSELRAANPHKPLNKEKNNWKSLTPGEELGVPDPWPSSIAAQPVSGPAAPAPSPNTPSAPNPSTPAPAPSPSTPTPAPGLETGPGLPGPGKNTTMDPGLIGNVQFMLAHWSVRYGEANPRDYGMLYNNSALDITNSWNPRTKMALQSFLCRRSPKSAENVTTSSARRSSQRVPSPGARSSSRGQTARRTWACGRLQKRRRPGARPPGLPCRAGA